MVNPEVQHNFGEQPISRIMADNKLKPHDLVAASTEHITHKMVTKACRGRRLTPHIKVKVTTALNTASGGSYSVKDLFSY